MGGKWQIKGFLPCEGEEPHACLASHKCKGPEAKVHYSEVREVTGSQMLLTNEGLGHLL